MGDQNISTWTQSPPTRPTVATFGGINVQDDAQSPPTDPTFPNASLFNQNSSTNQSVGQVCPNATVSVTGGAVPVISAITACNPAITLASATLGVYRASAGQVWICWPANTFPAQVCGDKAYLNVNLGAHNYAIGVTRGVVPAGGGALAGLAGVLVSTVEDAALSDLSFTVDIM